MPEAPARNGATARTMPMKRPTRIALGPWRSKKRLDALQARRGDAEARAAGDEEAPAQALAEREAREVAERRGQPGDER